MISYRRSARAFVAAINSEKCECVAVSLCCTSVWAAERRQKPELNLEVVHPQPGNAFSLKLNVGWKSRGLSPSLEFFFSFLSFFLCCCVPEKLVEPARRERL